MQRRPHHTFLIPIAFCVIAALSFVAKAEQLPLEVIYPAPRSGLDTRDDDALELLRTALEKTVITDGPFVLKPTLARMSPTRAHLELERGETLNVFFETPTVEFEKRFIPIRIPIRKGLLGYRVLLIRKTDQSKFSAVNSIKELQAFTVGQGQGWSDVTVYEANRFDVVASDTYEGLFAMLMFGRFDCFPRGINEAPAEYEIRKSLYPGLWLEEDLLIYYPFPKYFFVSPQHPQLAERIEKGLNIMLEDGTYEQIFLKYHAEEIKQLNLEKRRVFEIDNHLLPSTVPLDRKELWFKP